MLDRIRHTIGQTLLNAIGWHTNRKIVVIESDDWGSIRMPSKDVYTYLLKQGLHVDQCHYCKYDSLAGEEDLSELFNVLMSFRDHCGNHPVITANALVANPDFRMIKADNYSKYHYQLITDTLKDYPQHANSFRLWKEGIRLNIFRPQFHGREHLHVSRWLHYLRNQSKETHIAFEQKMFGLSTHVTNEKRKSYMAAFDVETEEEKNSQFSIITDGIHLFKELFGYSPLSFIAPNYRWSSTLETALYRNGIQSIQGLFTHKDLENRKQKIRYTGQINTSKLCSLVRNVFFEPAEFAEKDWISTCLMDIAKAFRWKKPAIICSHRVNFIGYIDVNNRSRNLKLLRMLLSEIQKKWPDVEFMSSDALTKLILHGEC